MMDQDFSDLHQASELEEKIQDLIAQVSSLKAELLQAQKEKGDLVQKIIDKDMQNYNLTVVTEKMLSEAQSEIDRLKSLVQLHQSEDAAVSALKKELVQAQVRAKQGEKERDELMKQVAEKDAEFQNIMTTVQEMCSKASTEIDRLNAEKMQLQNAHDGFVSSLKEKLVQAQVQAEKERDILRQQGAEKDAVIQNIREVRSDVRALQEEMKVLQLKVEELPWRVQEQLKVSLQKPEARARVLEDASQLNASQPKVTSQQVLSMLKKLSVTMTHQQEKDRAFMERFRGRNKKLSGSKRMLMSELHPGLNAAVHMEAGDRQDVHLHQPGLSPSLEGGDTTVHQMHRKQTLQTDEELHKEEDEHHIEDIRHEEEEICEEEDKRMEILLNPKKVLQKNRLSKWFFKFRT